MHVSSIRVRDRDRDSRQDRPQHYKHLLENGTPSAATLGIHVSRIYNGVIIVNTSSMMRLQLEGRRLRHWYAIADIAAFLLPFRM